MVRILLVEDSPSVIESHTKLIQTPAKTAEELALEISERIMGFDPIPKNPDEVELPPNIEIIVAKSYNEAVALFAEFPPDIIITDQQFPREEGWGTADLGFEFIQHVRQNSETRIPVIWNSAACADVILELATTKTGDADYAFRKPVDKKAFKQAVKDAINSLTFSEAIVDKNTVGFVTELEVTAELKERVAETIAAATGISIEEARDVGEWQEGGVLIVGLDRMSGFNQEASDKIMQMFGPLMTFECKGEFKDAASHLIGAEVTVSGEAEEKVEILRPEERNPRAGQPSTKSKETTDCRARVVDITVEDITQRE